MRKPNDLSRSLSVLNRNSTLIAVIVQPYLEPYLGGDSFEAVRIGGFDKRCGV